MTAPVGAVAGAVYVVVAPVAGLTPPPPLTDQETVGWVARAVPNWSCTVPANGCVAFKASVAVGGETAMLVGVAFTTTEAALVVLRPPASLIVT